VREVDYGHLVEVSWTVVAPTGAKSSGVKRVQITDSMASVVQLGLLAQPTPVPPYTGGYALAPDLAAEVVTRAAADAALDVRVGVLEGAPPAHGHVIADTTGLQAALDGKADDLGPDDNYVTDAEKVKLSNLSGTNTGDQTLPTWTTIAGKPAVVAEGATQADARTAIGAGTSSFSGVYADLTSKPTLGDAAAKNTGTTAGTLAAGDDSRIGKIGGTVTVTGTPTAGQVPIASSGTAAAWGTPSGGGGAGVPPVVIGGTYTAPPGYHVIYRDIAVTAPSDTARYYPMRLDTAWEITAVGINVLTLAAGSLVHVALYDDVGNNMTPGTRIAAPSGAGFSGATTGAKEATGLSITLAAGNYVWVIVGESGSPVLLGYRIATPFIGTSINNQIATSVEKIGATIPPPTTGEAPSRVNVSAASYAGAIWLKGIPA